MISFIPLDPTWTGMAVSRVPPPARPLSSVGLMTLAAGSSQDGPHPEEAALQTPHALIARAARWRAASPWSPAPKQGIGRAIAVEFGGPPGADVALNYLDDRTAARGNGGVRSANLGRRAILLPGRCLHRGAGRRDDGHGRGAAGPAGRAGEQRRHLSARAHAGDDGRRIGTPCWT